MKRVIIFDWDDTLCPSSFVDKWRIGRYQELPQHVQNLLDEVGRASERCLAEAAKYGEVLIITNSDEGWVKFSAERFIPYILPCLNDYNIISARTRYERFYPQQPLCWKAAAFAHEVNEIFNAQPSAVGERDDATETNSAAGSMVLTDDSVSDSSNASKNDEKQSQERGHHQRREVISFGDAMEERTAVRIVANQLEGHPKSVMFLNSPSPVQLIGQLEMLKENMKFVCEHELDLDLEISPEQAQDSAESRGLPPDNLIDQELSNWLNCMEEE